MTSTQQPGKPTSIAHGTLLVVGMRWVDRAIGLLSTIILARLLVPEDIGVVAMATMAIGLATVFLDLGVNIALIRNPHATQAHYDAAWTLRIMQASGLAVILWLGAPFAGTYFHEERVVAVLRLLAFGILVGGFENIGVVAFQKEMRFAREFQFTFTRRILAFLITIATAWHLRSYWALVIGTLGGQLLGVGLSYVFHPMRPSISTKEIHGIVSVSQWVLLRSIGAYLDNSLHRILVGRRAPAATLGAYALADDISGMPSTEVLAPLNRVLFPSFVRAKEQPGELKRLFLLAQGLQTLIGMPAAVGLALVAPEVVTVFLGARWSAAIPFIQLLAVAGVLQAITTSPGYVMITLGEVRRSATVVWIRVVLFLAGVFLLPSSAGAYDLAVLRVTCMTMTLVLTIWFLRKTFPEVRLFEIVMTISRPIGGVIAMAAVLRWGLASLAFPAVAALMVKVTVGAITYTIAIVALWLLAGRPVGAERYLADTVRSTLKARGILR